MLLGAPMSAATAPAIDDVTAAPVESTHKRQKNARWSIPPDIMQGLVSAYEQDPWPDIATRKQIALKLGCEEKQVLVWFQNRRARLGEGPRPKAGTVPYGNYMHMQNMRITTPAPTVPHTGSVLPPYMLQVPSGAIMPAAVNCAGVFTMADGANRMSPCFSVHVTDAATAAPIPSSRAAVTLASGAKSPRLAAFGDSSGGAKWCENTVLSTKPPPAPRVACPSMPMPTTPSTASAMAAKAPPAGAHPKWASMGCLGSTSWVMGPPPTPVPSNRVPRPASCPPLCSTAASEPAKQSPLPLAPASASSALSAKTAQAKRSCAQSQQSICALTNAAGLSALIPHASATVPGSVGLLPVMRSQRQDSLASMTSTGELSDLEELHELLAATTSPDPDGDDIGHDLDPDLDAELWWAVIDEACDEEASDLEALALSSPRHGARISTDAMQAEHATDAMQSEHTTSDAEANVTFDAEEGLLAVIKQMLPLHAVDQSPADARVKGWAKGDERSQCGSAADGPPPLQSPNSSSSTDADCVWATEREREEACEEAERLSTQSEALLSAAATDTANSAYRPASPSAIGSREDTLVRGSSLSEDLFTSLVSSLSCFASPLYTPDVDAACFTASSLFANPRRDDDDC